MLGFLTRLEAARRGLRLAGRDISEDERYDAVQKCSRAWPLVKFTNDSERLCVPEEFTVHGALGNVEASRTQVRENHIANGITDADCQVPLILAWALSVHKSQGQTLERVSVDLRKTFEKGQGIIVA